MNYFALWTVGLLLLAGSSWAQEEPPTVEPDLGAAREGSRTDSESLSGAQLDALRAGADKFTFQTEVNRMMKLIINSLYRNKEIFLRELISNASDALDKIRLLALTDRSALEANPDLAIRIKADPERRELHIADSGVGMTRADLVNNLGTIAKSGTADFLSKMQDAEASASAGDTNDMIGQFGVGFYSAFLVADRVTVASKHQHDQQHVWTSDADSFDVAQDPRGDTLRRGTHITLHLKEEAADFLQPDTIKNLVKKYSQFINFPIYLWTSREETVTIESEDAAEEDEDAKVSDEEAPKTSTRTVWEWQLMNDHKPLWTRKPAEVADHEYSTFYKALTKDTADPLSWAHFVAEGEVSFRALVFVPRTQPSDSFNRYGTRTDHIKLYVRRVFITDEFSDLMPNYLAFIQGVVDSDDLPLNVSRETLQQHKLIKIIKKKLVRKVLDMLRKIDPDDYLAFWKEYSTNIKLGVMEDPSNRSRLAKLLRFQSSHQQEQWSLDQYVERMKPNQERIYYVAGSSRAELQKSPFAERLLAQGYEVLFLVEPVDEYCIAALPEYDGHKFQNIAKEILDINEGEDEKEQLEAQKKEFEPLTSWFTSQFSDVINKAAVSRRLANSPAALVASAFGWTGNMERLAMSNAHQKADDAARRHQLQQKKGLELNPRHPLVQELLRRVKDDPEDQEARNAALALLRSATLRSGFALHDGAALDFASQVERLLASSMGVDPTVTVEAEQFSADQVVDEDAEEHDEL